MTKGRTLAEIHPPEGASAKEWADHIQTCWKTSVNGIIHTGRLFREAKQALPHGQFGVMLNELKCNERVAQMFMEIERNPRFSNPQIISLLPPCYTTMHAVGKMADDEFQVALDGEVIRPDMKGRDITQAAKKNKRASKEEALAAKIEALPDRRYGVIVADPPWQFEPWSRKTGMDRAADNHYPTSCNVIIESLDVPSIASEDCILFLWATAPMLPHALLVMAAWGFDYRSNYVWNKDRIGTGYWNRNAHEHLLIGVKGDVPAPSPGTQRPSVIEGKVTKHSAKPECFLEMIEQYFPNLPKIELNRRGPARKGWDAWGNESESTTSNLPGPNVVPEPAPAAAEVAGSTSPLDIPDFLQREGSSDDKRSSSSRARVS